MRKVEGLQGKQHVIDAQAHVEKGMADFSRDKPGAKETLQQVSRSCRPMRWLIQDALTLWPAIGRRRACLAVLTGWAWGGNPPCYAP